MKIGIPKEIKDHEFRVGATPAMVHALVSAGHEVCVQQDAGSKIGFSDTLYRASGATIVKTAEEVYRAEMVVKVKEPQESEFPLLRRGLILFCYLHLAPNPILTKALVESEVIAIAYETVTDEKGHLPLLIPMSEMAGRLSIQVGATALQMCYGGKGVLLGGVPGVHSSRVVIIGGGVVGTEAARMALGLGADVVILDKNLERLRDLDALFGPRLKTLYATATALEEEVSTADLVIGAVLVPGCKAPKLISHAMIKSMQPGSVLVDVAIDQGGCSETSRPTTHSAPTYIVDGVVHYCVTNMPGACARTATLALTNATMEYVLLLASKGYAGSPALLQGLNVCLGKVTNKGVAENLGYAYVLPTC